MWLEGSPRLVPSLYFPCPAGRTTRQEPCLKRPGDSSGAEWAAQRETGHVIPGVEKPTFPSFSRVSAQAPHESFHLRLPSKDCRATTQFLGLGTSRGLLPILKKLSEWFEDEELEDLASTSPWWENRRSSEDCGRFQSTLCGEDEWLFLQAA